MRRKHVPKRFSRRELDEVLQAKQAMVRARPPRGARVPWSQWYEAHDGRDLRRHGLHILGVGIGRKIVGGAPTDQLSVRVYVTRKLPKRAIRSSARIPGRIAGLPTDVIESAVAHFAATPKCSVQRLREQRPIRPGISAANEGVTAGTLGAICRSTRLGENAARFVLSNNHVLADYGHATIGSAILQPALSEGGLPLQRVAALSRFAPIDESPNGVNRVDAAIAQIDPGIAWSSDICGIGRVQGSTTPVPDMQVHKHGRSSGSAVGKIVDPAIDIVIPLPRDGAEVLCRFVNQMRVEPVMPFALFAQAGDSGSLIVAKASNKAVALLFACPRVGGFAYANPIREVLAALDIVLE